MNALGAAACCRNMSTVPDLREIVSGILTAAKKGALNLPGIPREFYLNALDKLADDKNAGSEKDIGERLFVWIASKGCLDLVRRFLAAGINPDSCPHGQSPLHMAAFWGHTTVIHALLEAGADKERAVVGTGVAPPGEGDTPLLAAAQTGRVEAIRLLLGAGANLEKGNAVTGKTPIYYAAATGHAGG